MVSEDGVIILLGAAKNEAEKSLVAKLVSDITGASRVANGFASSPPET